MKVYPWLIDLIHRRKNGPTGMISEWVQKVTEHRGAIQWKSKFTDDFKKLFLIFFLFLLQRHAEFRNVDASLAGWHGATVALTGRPVIQPGLHAGGVHRYYLRYFTFSCYRLQFLGHENVFHRIFSSVEFCFSALFGIPIYDSRIEALHQLFTLFVDFKEIST